MTQIRDGVRGQVRSQIRGQTTVARGIGEVFYDGISFDAATQRVILKAAGASPTATTLTSAFTFTGGNQSLFRGPAGLLVPSATNTPRIEYGPGGDCLGLLMEASRTNLALNNGDLSNATWTKSNCSVSSTTSADGTARNTRIVEDGTTNIHGVIAGVTVTANTTYCLSAIVTPRGRQFCFMYGINVDQFGAVFDFVNLTSAQIISGTSTINQRGIVPFGNGRFLVWVSGVLNAASTTLNFVAGPATSLTVPAGYTYLGDGASGVDMDFIQIELGAFPSSRILTAGTSVARTADVCTRTLGSEFSASVGSMVVAGSWRTVDAGTSQSVVSFSDGTVNNRINLTRPQGTSTARLNVTTATVLQFTLDNALTDFARYKAAIAWATNDFAYAYNGGAVQVSATGTLPTTPSLELGHIASLSQANSHIRTFRYYSTRLPNNMLQQLSA